MKYLGFVVLPLLLLACTESPQPVAANRPTLVAKDSDLLRRDTLNPFAPLDRSPMDISYYPVDYTIEKASGATTAPPKARVLYSRPHRQGREIFGSLIKYGEPWRLGANEATELEFFQPATIQGKTIPKGRYVLYTIPQPDKWTIVFNTYLFGWGLKPNPEKDLHRFDVPVTSNGETIEYFSMVFQQNKTGGADLVIAWDMVVARLPISF